MYEVTKDFAFEAAHRLTRVSADHKCARMHGHRYEVRLTLRAERLDELGFVVDFGDLSAFGDWLRDTFDHRVLNDVVAFETTAENLARHLYEWARARWSQAAAVTVAETHKCTATYRP